MNTHLCISIPEELKQYTKLEELQEQNEDEDKKLTNDFGVKIIKDEEGNLVCTAYYSDIGEIIKKIYYIGSSVASIEHYRNNSLYSHEKFGNGRLCKKSKYDKQGKVTCTVKYDYNKSEQIISIQKILNEIRYLVNYGYDELKRVNSRVIRINDKILDEQAFRYDILDRIVEYRDNNQNIKVHKINQKNELVSYTITDNANNEISILNKFICTDYIGTEIELNGHKTTVKDYSYVDNVMLKKPFTSEDDLDFAISNILKKSGNNVGKTSRNSNNDNIDTIIGNSIKEFDKPLLPISIRKQLLLNKT